MPFVVKFFMGKSWIKIPIPAGAANYLYPLFVVPFSFFFCPVSLYTALRNVWVFVLLRNKLFFNPTMCHPAERQTQTFLKAV